MENWIRNVSEPGRLLLAWQAAEHMKVRTRFAVAEIVREGSEHILRYFDSDEVAGEELSAMLDIQHSSSVRKCTAKVCYDILASVTASQQE